MNRRFWVIGLLIIAASVGVWYNFISQEQHVRPKESQQEQAETGVTEGKKVPVFTLAGTDNKPVRIGTPGKPYVINFWASWCPPCRAEFPELEQFYRRDGGKVQFYAVNLQEPAEKVTAFMQQNSYTMPVLLDKDGVVARIFRITAIPTTLIVDSKGIIRYRKTGGTTEAELENVIKKL
ncbi:redoxin [Lucifera butyrica]|uniref:Redoxin n=1 Tax=Lucifera butyrica TaxID=1351585 RepID=A0A498RGK6_9FIRM|nr:TlpA disulfide reductase family protein [Lucifera butyrica]VBB08248.1 redoxin [Lucifera butyrica]